MTLARSPLAHTNIVYMTVAVALTVTLLVSGAFVTPARAGCTNYDDYLHWLSRIDTDGNAGDIFVQGTYAYFAEGADGAFRFHVVDVSNPGAPFSVGVMDLPCTMGKLAVSGDIAVLSSSSSATDGLFFIDISDPSSPSMIGSALPGVAGTNLAISGSVVYVMANTPAWRLHIIDFADPENLAVHPEVALSNQPTGAVVIKGDHAYLSACYLITVDISDPATASVVDTYIPENTRAIRDIALYGDYIFASTRHVSANPDLRSFSLANPAHPQAVSTTGTLFPGGGVYPYVTVAADVCYYGYGTHLLYMFDVSNPASMSSLGTLPHPGGSLREIEAFGDNLYQMRMDVPAATGTIHIVSVSSPSPLEPISSVDTDGDALGVVLAPGRNNLAYVADGSAGVQVVDISDPLNPYIIGAVDTPGSATEIVLVDTLAYVADNDAGLQVVNVAVPSNPTIIGSVDTPGLAVDIAVVDTLVYIADTDQGLRIIDVADPTDPKLRGAELSLLQAQGVDVAGTVAYVANGMDGLSTVNVSDPDNPWIIDGVKGRGLDNARKVEVRHDRAYVTDSTAGLVILDVSDPADLQELSGADTENTAGDVDLMGIFAYVGSGAGVQLIDIRDDQNPITVGSVTVPATSRGMFVNEYYAYIAAGGSGLQVCPTQCGFDELVIADFAADVQEGFYPLTVEFTNQSEGYGLVWNWDFDDGTASTSERNPSYTFTEPGDYAVTLTATNGTNVDSTTVVISALAEAPTIVSIDDIPDDQGGYVYVKFYHSAYDDTELGRSEMYTLERLDGDVWVSLSSIGAYGEHYRTALGETQGDGADNWTTTFRVIAHMDEGNWASTPMAGFSQDNIAPEAPRNVAWTGPGVLNWDQVAAEDLAYYRIYGSTGPSFEDAVSLATTVETFLDLGATTQNWVFVVAVDDAEQESDPSAPLSVSGTPDAITAISLAQPYPNPFNPSTTFVFELPRSEPTRLTVYDAGGRRVRVLLDEVVPTGTHRLVWRGLDQAGRRVSSGAYFGRLEAGGKVIIRRVMLVK